jgi:hypothetical protein
MKSLKKEIKIKVKKKVEPRSWKLEIGRRKMRNWKRKDDVM